VNWNIPNILTTFRMFAAPAVVLVFLCLARPYADWAALILFVGAAITDYFDGYLARKWNQQSAFGTMLDPIADKAMVILAFLAIVGLYGLTWLIAIPATVILLREVFVSGLREFLGDNASKLAVTEEDLVGLKWNYLGTYYSYWVGVVLLWIAGVLTLITGLDYLRKAMPFLKGAK